MMMTGDILLSNMFGSHLTARNPIPRVVARGQRHGSNILQLEQAVQEHDEHR